MASYGNGIEKLIETETYATICEKWGLTEDCFANDYLNQTGVVPIYNKRVAVLGAGRVDAAATDVDRPRRVASTPRLRSGSSDRGVDATRLRYATEQDLGCADGYCSCDDIPSREPLP